MLGSLYFEINTLPVVAQFNKEGDSENKRDQVFVSYSHNDEKFLKDIKRHFKPFLDKIKFWDDSEISPGADWRLKRLFHQQKSLFYWQQLIF